MPTEPAEEQGQDRVNKYFMRLLHLRYDVLDVRTRLLAACCTYVTTASINSAVPYC